MTTKEKKMMMIKIKKDLKKKGRGGRGALERFR